VRCRQVRANQVQALGDMPTNGKVDNLNYAKSLLTATGVPFRDAPGNHEITQGADPEDGNFAPYSVRPIIPTWTARRTSSSATPATSGCSPPTRSSRWIPEYRIPMLVDQLTAKPIKGGDRGHSTRRRTIHIPVRTASFPIGGGADV